MTAAIDTSFPMTNIPWDKAPKGLIRDDSEMPISAQSAISEMKPVARDMGIDFNDDTWDFSEMLPNLSDRPKARVSFIGIDAELKTAVKFWVINALMSELKPNTAKIHVTNFRKAYNAVGKPYSTITAEDIIKVVEGSETKLASQFTTISGVITIADYLIKDCGFPLPVDIAALSKIRKAYGKRLLNKSDKEKLPNIPAEYHRLILAKAIRVMRSKKADPSMRAVACEIIILSQLGLRRGDLMRLTTDALRERTLLKSGKRVAYIHFIMEKNSRADGFANEFDVACNELCAEAFKTLLKVREAFDGAADTDYLYLTGRCRLPVAPNVWDAKYKKFMYTYLKKECTHPWPGINKSILNFHNRRGKVDVWVPKSGQFRVFLCTSLYEQNVSSQYVMQHMGHLSEFMEGYYNRPKEHGQENAEYAARTLRQIVGEEDLRPLGAMGDEIKAGLKGVIDEIDPRVEKDFNEIVKSCEGKVAIRAKLAGVCIKSGLIPCSQDAQTDKAMCAFGICPNLFHFYYNIDITWSDFQSTRDAYRHNAYIGRKQAASKELNKLKDIVRRRLIPELDELETELGRRDMGYILEKHPHLEEIIPVRVEMRKEAESWLQK